MLNSEHSFPYTIPLVCCTWSTHLMYSLRNNVVKNSSIIDGILLFVGQLFESRRSPLQGETLSVFNHGGNVKRDCKCANE